MISLVLALFSLSAIPVKASTVDDVKARGTLNCGVTQGLAGFSSADSQGNWTGLDADFCRAVAAAIFDDPKKAKFVPLDANERFKELQSRKVDILSRNSTWSMSRETSYDLYFPAVAYYDGEVWRRNEGQLRSALVETALHRAPIGRNRRPLPRFDLDHAKRYRSRYLFCGCHLL
jgi:ABC-type amino acid transport substrate-binding protein